MQVTVACSYATAVKASGHVAYGVEYSMANGWRWIGVQSFTHTGAVGDVSART